MTRYLGKARNLMTPAETRALVYRVKPWGLLAWASRSCGSPAVEVCRDPERR